MVDGIRTRQSTKKNVSSAYPTGSVSWTEKPIPGLTITTAFVVWLGSTTVIVPALAQKYYYDSGNSSNSLLLLPPISILGWSIMFFNNLNVLIAFCEIALGNHITYIQDHYRSLVKEYRDDKKGKPTLGGRPAMPPPSSHIAASMAGSWLAFADDCAGCSSAYSVDLCVLMLLDGILPGGPHRIQATAN